MVNTTKPDKTKQLMWFFLFFFFPVSCLFLVFLGPLQIITFEFWFSNHLKFCPVLFGFPSLFLLPSNFCCYFSDFQAVNVLGLSVNLSLAIWERSLRKNKIINATFKVFPKRSVPPVESIMDPQLQKGENHCLTPSNTSARFRITWTTWEGAPGDALWLLRNETHVFGQATIRIHFWLETALWEDTCPCQHARHAVRRTHTRPPEPW